MVYLAFLWGEVTCIFSSQYFLNDKMGLSWLRFLWDPGPPDNVLPTTTVMICKTSLMWPWCVMIDSYMTNDPTFSKLVQLFTCFFQSISHFCPSFKKNCQSIPGIRFVGSWTSILTFRLSPLDYHPIWHEFSHIHQSMTSNSGQWMVRFYPKLLAPSSIWPTSSPTTSATTPALPQTHSDKSLAPSSS